MSHNFDFYRRLQGAAGCGYDSRFVCGSTCCTVAPSAPANGVGVYDRFVPYGGAVETYYGTQSVLGGAAGCAYDASGQRGPAGWAEVGYVVSARHRRKRNEHIGKRKRPASRGRRALRPGRRPVSRTAPVASFTPRADFQRFAENDCSDARRGGFDFEDDFTDNESELLAVDCRARRYRLYTRPAHGWCGSYDVHQWQYAVTEEGVPRCDAILLVLRDNPRVSNPRSLVWQELHTGDLVHVPGEPGAFRVHLYADDYFTH